MYTNNGTQQGPDEIQRFMGNMMRLVDRMHRILWEVNDKGYNQIDPKLVPIVKIFLQKYGDEKVINTFISNSKDYWNEIYNRNVDYFVDNAYRLFDKLPIPDSKKKINAFTFVFTQKEGTDYVVKQKHRAAIWEFFHSLVKIAIKYVHKKRTPVKVLVDGRVRYRYQKKDEWYPDLDIPGLARKWEIKLPAC